jgi:nucleoside-diphosphate-sugar epimerase
VRVLDQCRRNGCSLTYISAYIYGQPHRLPIAETDPVAANNPYAFSKFMAEEACRFFFNNFDLPVTILRPFNIYGPGQSEQFLLTRIAVQAVDRNCQEIVVTDLTPRRDYIFISDAIDAILVSLQTKPGSLFNIGSGTSYSVADAIQTVCRVAGVTKPFRAIVSATRRNEINDVVADITALRAETGWTPRVSFDDGLRQLIEGLRLQ